MASAVDAGAAAIPALIIADIDLPDPALPAIRRRHPAARLLAISAEGKGAEAAGLLEKPFTPSQLLATVRLCLARPPVSANPT